MAGFICEVLICVNFARNHELTTEISTNNNKLFYVAVMQFANLIIANITARLSE